MELFYFHDGSTILDVMFITKKQAAELENCAVDIGSTIRPATFEDLPQLIQELVGKTTHKYWLRRIIQRHEGSGTSFVIKGNHYIIEREDEKKQWKGFGGRRFIIEADDGRTIETTNLWSQGIIPPLYVRLLSDNARFLPLPDGVPAFAGGV